MKKIRLTKILLQLLQENKMKYYLREMSFSLSFEMI